MPKSYNKSSKRVGSHGEVRDSSKKAAPRYKDGLKCCLCGGIAHYKVYGSGYCMDHKKEAYASQAKHSTSTYMYNSEGVGLPVGAALSQRSIG